MKKLLVMDNYDSFTFNLVHILEASEQYDIVVRRNDAISLEEVGDYAKIIFSPGPGLPREAGIMLDAIRHYATMIPMLGVCLGHQAIIESFGGDLINLEKVHHGVASDMLLTKAPCPLMEGVSKSFVAGRYHSWVADRASFPEELIITATDTDGEVMGFRHNHLPIFGVQFHPESIMTKHGDKILNNFLQV